MTDPDNLWDDEMGIYVDYDVLSRKEWQRAVYLELYESDTDPELLRGFKSWLKLRVRAHLVNPPWLVLRLFD